MKLFQKIHQSLFCICLLASITLTASAQQGDTIKARIITPVPKDTIKKTSNTPNLNTKEKEPTRPAQTDTLLKNITDTLVADKTDTLSLLIGDTVKIKKKRNWASWRPETKRALWLSLVLPGAGQIYNRKYWKLPIIYGGFAGCIYALRWNNTMYKDYSQAYMDLMDNDPNTQSYNKFLYLGNQIDSSNSNYYQKLFKNRKDRYRRWRDLSVFAMIGVYVLSVVDAYVDASLSEFDISKDLSLKVAPSVIKNKQEWSTNNSLYTSAIGFQCNLTF